MVHPCDAPCVFQQSLWSEVFHDHPLVGVGGGFYGVQIAVDALQCSVQHRCGSALGFFADNTARLQEQRAKGGNEDGYGQQEETQTEFHR